MHKLFEIPSITLFLCVFCAFLWLKICLPSEIVKRYLTGVKSAFIIRVIPWLTKDLRVSKALYNCRDTSTNVMSALQISPFCSNKPNFRKSQMNVNNVLTTDYDKKDTWSIGKNKPNTNPIQSQFKPNQSQYKPNTNPNQTHFQRQKIEKGE
ncbi:MAG: hypothetical protein WBC22_18255 [Sedimentisphaerales bacterium]